MGKKYSFKAVIADKVNSVYSRHLIVPQKTYEALTSDGVKRVLCYIDNHPYFHAGMMPMGDGNQFILLSKPRLKEMGLDIGMEINVKLEKDTSKYGMYVPEEFEEVLHSDGEGLACFEKLTDGKKRNLIHMVASTKSPDLRITKALIIIDHIKANEGKIDFKELQIAMKPENRKY